MPWGRSVKLGKNLIICDTGFKQGKRTWRIFWFNLLLHKAGEDMSEMYVCYAQLRLVQGPALIRIPICKSPTAAVVWTASGIIPVSLKQFLPTPKIVVAQNLFYSWPFHCWEEHRWLGFCNNRRIMNKVWIITMMLRSMTTKTVMMLFMMKRTTTTTATVSTWWWWWWGRGEMDRDCKYGRSTIKELWI